MRSQLRLRRATDDPSPADREEDRLVAPQTLVLGLTPRLTAFVTLPVLAHGRAASSSGTTRTDPAVGDLALLGRYTLWWDDYAPLATRRTALVAGVKLPTGVDRFGSETFDPVLGGVATWAFDRHEIDVDSLYTVSTRRNGFRQESVFAMTWPTLPALARTLRNATSAAERTPGAERAVERSKPRGRSHSDQLRGACPVPGARAPARLDAVDRRGLLPGSHRSRSARRAGGAGLRRRAQHPRAIHAPAPVSEAYAT